jgi:arsenical pump membrane protein
MLWRPRGIREAWWVCGGAALLVLLGLLPWRAAAHAAGRGTDVYLFLTGMMLLSEVAREHGVFDWVAAHAVDRAGGSAWRLFLLVYAAGIAVTALMSNDATAVVLTPAVLAAVKPNGNQGPDPQPYLFACAMVSNAASFVLPIANPANLVVYQAGALPGLGKWLGMFLLPSVASVAVTLLVLAVWFRRELRTGNLPAVAPRPLTPTGRVVVWGIGVMSAVLLLASARQWKLGPPACMAALGVALLASWRAGHAQHRVLARLREVFSGVSWSVLPLVAGLFCLVAAANSVGLEAAAVHLLRGMEHWPAAGRVFAAGLGIGVFDNLVNNLPAGLLAGGAAHAAGAGPLLRRAVLLGVDLGPNLSVTGSLATILWMMRIRREGMAVGARQFLLLGMVAMPLALSASLAMLLLK